MASAVYAYGIGGFCGADIDWDDNGGTTIKAMLTLEDYTVNKDTHDFLDDVSANRATGSTDQTMGTSRTIDYVPASDYVHLKGAATVTYTAVPVQTGNKTVTGVVIYKDTGTPATSRLISWNEFASAISPNGSDIQVTFDAAGVVRFTN